MHDHYAFPGPLFLVQNMTGASKRLLIFLFLLEIVSRNTGHGLRGVSRLTKMFPRKMDTHQWLRTLNMFHYRPL